MRRISGVGLSRIKTEILPLRGCYAIGHDTGLRMTNKGKPEIPRSLRSLGTTNINGSFGTTMKALSS